MIDDFFHRVYRVLDEPVLALFSSIALIFGGYHLRKPPSKGDFLNWLHPLIENIANASIFVGFTILVLFLVIKIVQNR
jgi:TRAP-type C4-dicarboxylate transport system permease small subunit